MANLYRVRLVDGSLYEVSTNKHHDDPDGEAFRRHLLEIIAAVHPGTECSAIAGFDFQGPSLNVARRLITV